jgi:serine/threonine-protein kinase RsbW
MRDENGRGGRVVRLIYPCDLEFLPVLNAVVEEFVRLAGADEEDANAIANAVLEAGTNAAQYGGGENEVEVEFRAGEGEVEVAVSDRGPGFDPERVSEPGDPTGPISLRGRGVLIMTELMDEVCFEDRPGGGTTVWLRKALKRGGS